MRYYTSLCDIKYAPRLLAMYESMATWLTREPWRLYVLCFDLETYDVLRDTNNVIPIKLGQFLSEFKEAMIARSNRTPTEFMWTCASMFTYYIWESTSRKEIIYLDADLFFFVSPAILSSIPGDKSIAAVPHRWTPKYTQRLQVNGTYNVSAILFRGSTGGAALRWWATQCLTWCYNRVEDGKFADQGYLDEMARIWNRHWYAYESPGIGLAPWNQEQYAYRMIQAPDPRSFSWEPTVDGWANPPDQLICRTINLPAICREGKYPDPIIFYHMHELQTTAGSISRLTYYPVHPFVERNIYGPYREAYRNAWEECKNRLCKNYTY